ncbi:cell wall hydrolase [Desulforamulus aquiferis]|uniref:LysM peptidoglycan-binding domain-containing protein n=1 Tax=Desulforamulus aquiferis TaxID=1397668 RepID=A0AAW7Z953_9FIRM|nr:cell wall hydrolase [Desulforamulus aquiferis]MDO7785784.1 LysM peptidoglycan-binding domain-containing protein [Desulforamulus aquiferis]RYD06703.1 hypothetical protein N752_03245 [Desulforamulus aquiferis]
MNISKRIKRLVVALCFVGLMTPAFAAYGYDYTVQTGDSLYIISQKTGVGIDAIKSSNKLTGDLLQPGQVLNIPDSQAKQATPQQTASTYTVKAGDSLFTIAQNQGIRLEALIVANSISGTLIYPGQQLNVPVAASRSAGAVVEVSRSAKRPVIPFTDEDFDLLSRLVNAEAGGEPLDAQVGVAAVVINRVRSGIFPNSIREVIYSPNQFSPVRNGWINRPATEKSKEATLDALYGSDPTNGALYFFDTSTRNTFLRSLPVAATYGQMIYANAK